MIADKVRYTKKLEIIPASTFSLSITKDGILPFNTFEWCEMPIPFLVAPISNCGSLVHYSSGHITNFSIKSKCDGNTFNFLVSNLRLKNYEPICAGQDVGFLQGNFIIPNNAVPDIFEVETEEVCFSDPNKLVETRNSKISAEFTVVGEFLINGVTHTLTGYSNTFTVLPFKDYYKLTKKNEDQSLVDLMKKMVKDERIINSKNYWNFVNGMFGNEIYDLNVSILEKTANFGNNNQIIDYCHNRKIKTFYQLFDESLNDYSIAQTPDSIERLLNIFSIDFNNLFGRKCSCNTFFKLDGIRSNDSPCKRCKQNRTINNLGEQLTFDYIVSAGVPFLYNVRGTEDVEIIYPTVQDGLSNYPLSALQEQCVLQNYNDGCNCAEGLSFKNYCFFAWNTTPQNNTIDNYILLNKDFEFTNLTNNTTPKEWETEIVDEILSFTLNKELSAKFGDF